MASRYAQQRSQSEAQAIAIAMPRRQNSLLASPFSILSLLLIISIIIPILVNLVLILLGL
ncbi:MAG TPA: hypothetical protein VH186_35915 [Chloroflexia bacterium]|nr:hypothetical protein [Chloroflexia bacterium]